MQAEACIDGAIPLLAGRIDKEVTSSDNDPIERIRIHMVPHKITPFQKYDGIIIPSVWIVKGFQPTLKNPPLRGVGDEKAIDYS